MADRHPLHPKLIDALSEYKTCEEAMRAAADWQLKKVLKWLEDHAAEYAYEDYYGPCFNDNGLLKELKQAMRPTTTQENNQ